MTIEAGSSPVTAEDLRGPATALLTRLVPLAWGAAVGAVASAYLRAQRRRPHWCQPTREIVRARQLEVGTSGSGPPLVLLHGLVGSGRFWGAAYDVLAADHRLLVPDLLGFGRSEHPADGYGPDEHADAVASALGALGVDRPAIIGAHSLGTVIALRLAARHPHLVASVVAFGPPLYPDRSEALRRIGAASPLAKAFGLPGSLAERACRWMCAHHRAAAALARWSNPGLPPELAADAVEHTWSSYSETLGRCLLTGEPATWLRNISVPVHLIAGTRDPVVDFELLDELARRHDGVRVERWDGDHGLPLTEPGRCMTAILG